MRGWQYFECWQSRGSETAVGNTTRGPSGTTVRVISGRCSRRQGDSPGRECLVSAHAACGLGSSPTSVPPTNAPAASKTPLNFHNGGVTPEAVTEAPTSEEQSTPEEQPTQAPTKAATKAPTRVPTKVATKAAKPTATEAGGNTTGSCDTFKASTDVYWVTLDSNNNIQDTVTSYPDGVTEIAPV